MTNNSKWCALGDAPHWLKIDLGDSYAISKLLFIMLKQVASQKPLILKRFRIEISMDGEHWTEAVKVMDNISAVSEHSISLKKARYVRYG